MALDITSSQLHIEFSELSNKTDFTGFDCGDQDLNDFVKDGTALKYQSQHLAFTTCLHIHGELVGYYSIAADALPLQGKAKDDVKEGVAIRNFPALKLARMAIKLKHQRNELGRLVVSLVKGYALDLNKKGMAIRFITVDAYPHREKFYKNCGFIVNESQSRNRTTISMRCDIYK